MIPEESRIFSLQNHTIQAFQVMHELRLKTELCDVILKVDHQEFQAHKVVLAGCSPYLRAMFTNGMMESKKNEVEICGIDSKTMSLMLDFMYKGSAEITVKNVQQLLQGASMLHLTSLRNVCCQFLQHHIDATNCIGIHFLADMFSCSDLELAARRYIHQHYMEIVHADEFLQLTTDRLMHLLKSDELQVANEEDVFESALLWVQADSTNRAKIFCDILPYIRLPLLDRQYLENRVLPNDLIRSCVLCQPLVQMALKTRNDPEAMSSISKRALPLGIFVVGGRNWHESQLNTMERYDFIRDQWITMGCMNVARTAVSATSHNGILYVIGGECALAELQGETLYLQCVESFNPIIQEWHRCADLKVARSFIATVTAGGYIYAVGGEDRNSSYNSVERYNPKTDEWSQAQPMRQKRAGAGVAVCDGKIYVAGGYDKSFHTDRGSMECFDPEMDEWMFVAEMENPRSGLELVSVDHYLYALGGKSRYHMYYDIVERYNTLTHQWTNILSMNMPRAWPAASVVNRKIYVTGGFDGANRLRSVEMYDLDTESWVFITNMTVGRAGCGAAIL